MEQATASSTPSAAPTEPSRSGEAASTAPKPHEPPCEGCVKAEQLFLDLDALVRRAEELRETGALGVNEKQQLDDAHHEVKEARLHFLDYQAHVAQKRWEHLKTLEQQTEIKKDECDVTCDWKM